MIGKILVAVDGSDAAARAVDVGAELASATGAELVLLHAIRDLALPPEIMDMVNAGEINASRQEILEESGRIMLERGRERASAAGVEKVTTVLEYGDPGTVIIGHAERDGADLIVMGSRGLGEMKSLMLGSVSRKVCNLAPTSCLTVK